MPRQALAEQIATLVRRDYPSLFSMPEQAFTASLDELSKHVPSDSRGNDGRRAFVLVINSPLAPVASVLERAVRAGKSPVVKLYPKTLGDFTTVPEVELPLGDAYLLLDVDRGAEYLNVTPDAAQVAIAQASRSPLTILEGLALLTHAPELLQPNRCFSLLASRCGDKRVPALWLSEDRPKLGWCWAGNPHTWLGSASCAGRVGSVRLRSQTLDAV